MQFPLGQVVATPGALAALEAANDDGGIYLTRHAHNDWGEIAKGDEGLNDQALVDGGRLLSVYRLKDNTKIWIITEAADEDGNRLATTILLPSDY